MLLLKDLFIYLQTISSFRIKEVASKVMCELRNALSKIYPLGYLVHHSQSLDHRNLASLLALEFVKCVKKSVFSVRKLLVLYLYFEVLLFQGGLLGPSVIQPIVFVCN